MEILDDDSTSSVDDDSRAKFSGAFSFETEDEVVCLVSKVGGERVKSTSEMAHPS